MCLGIYELDEARFLSVSALTQKAVLEKTKIELQLLTEIYVNE